MAADASRSSAPSPDSYIGSVISLTSKCEIRYEGVLYNINTEESSIGLRNVRSFGTEGRKKDGPQIPANDKIYEYILFRGSDIKDLQVKSTPPVQTSSIHNDPAIIQSQYSLPTASTPTTVPSTFPSVAVPEPSSHTSQLGFQRPNFQGSLPPLYQSGPSMPQMYYQGFYPSSNILPQMPQSSFRGPSMQYPIMNPAPLFPPVSISQSLTSTILPPSQSSSLLTPDSATSLMPTVSLASSLPAISLVPNASLTSSLATSVGANLPLAPPSISNHDLLVERSNMSSTVSSNVNVPVGSSNSYPSGSAVSLVTPDNLLQTGPSTIPSSQPLQTADKDVLESTSKDEVKSQEVKKNSSEQKSFVSESTKRLPDKNKEPILPLPKPFHQKSNGADMHTHHYSRGRGRGGRVRGRGNGYLRPVHKFTEDFDFTAMNEKFNKDEVWGHLGKSNREGGEEDYEAENVEDDDAEIHKPEIKPVYVKDDFFDALSSNALDRNSQGSRPKFSEQRKIDKETFGDFTRQYSNRGGRGGSGFFRGGPRGRGSYNGRGGYGYVARGRGNNHAVSNRASE